MDPVYSYQCEDCGHEWVFRYDMEIICPKCGSQSISYSYNTGNFTVERKSVQDQTAKADEGKPELTLVPREIIRAIAKIRMYGNSKYHDPDNWKTVEAKRYRDAAYRHWLAYLDDPYGVDEESGLPHLWHMACNIAFLCEMEKDSYEKL